MREIHLLLPQDHQPVACHRWAQEELAWGFRDGPGEMSVPSAMGKMLEGSVRKVGADILEDPMLALEEAHQRTAAAERFRRFMTTLGGLLEPQRVILDRVYGDPLAETDLLAFGGAANLVPESDLTRNYHRRARTSIGYIAWLGDLRVRLAGERYEDSRIAGKYLRRPPRASEAEKSMAAEIRRDTESTLVKALAAYAMACPRR